MKIYQCIHKYPPHIPLFEKKHGITDSTNLSFKELQKLVIEDGYASSYILLPALEGRDDEVFYTIWDYERLQLLWAKEHGLKTNNLQEIKFAQIEWFKPDVFYDFSPTIDNTFTLKFPIHSSILKLCWYSIIEKEPYYLPYYDLRISLHRPYIEKWNQRNLNSLELQPSFVYNWEKYNQQEKPIDILFYGQFSDYFFSNRNKIIEQLILLKEKEKLNIQVYLQYSKKYEPYINLPLIRRISKVISPSKLILKNTNNSIYGEDLYATIGKSKFVLNGYGNFNKDFKSNMRLFEALGCGALLFSEKGNYPEGFEANKNYIPYANAEELIEIIPKKLAEYKQLREYQTPYISKVKEKYSKQNQWNKIKNAIKEMSIGRLSKS